MDPCELSYTEFLESAAERRRLRTPQITVGKCMPGNLRMYFVAHVRKANLCASWLTPRTYVRLDENELADCLSTGSWPSPHSRLWTRGRQWPLLFEALEAAERGCGLGVHRSDAQRTYVRLAALARLMLDYDRYRTLGDPLVHKVKELASPERVRRYSALFPSLRQLEVPAADRSPAYQCLAQLIHHFLMSLFAPIRTETDGGKSYVIVLDCVRFCRDLQTKELYVEHRGSDNRWCGPDYGFDLFAPLAEDHWAYVFAEKWLRQNAPGLERLTGWFGECLSREMKRVGFMKELNGRIRGVLPLDQDILRAALRLRHYCRGGSTLTNAQYQATWQSSERSLRLAREGPRIAPLFVQPTGARDPLGDNSDIGALKRLLYGNGVRNSGWTLLCRKGSRVYAPLTLVYPAPPTDAIAAWLCLLQSLNQRKAVPLAIGRMIFDVHVTRWDRDVAQLPPGMIRAASRQYESIAGKSQRSKFVAGPFARTLWWWRHTRPVLDHHQRRAPWSFWMRQCELWEIESQAKARAVQWISKLGSHESDGYRIVPLTTEWALLEDGFDMRHCVPVFLKDCREGRYRVFSLRRNDGVRLATVGLELKNRPGDTNPPHWTVQQVRGFANRAATKRQECAAIALAGRYRE